MKQNKKNSTFKPLWKKPAFIISALIVSVSVFAFGLNKKGQEKETKKELPTVAVNSNLTESHVILSLRPIDIMTTPQTLMNVWINEPIPLDQYSEKEKEVQQLINEKTTDGIITYSPLNGNKEYLDIDHEEITPYTWKWIKLELKKSDGTLSKISLRRPNWWITQNNADKVGNKVKLFLPEMGINGDATVTKINPNQLDTRFWNENRNGDYVSRPITGKFEHQSSDVANYYFKGLEKPIGATSSHPFWSLDRNEWVSVGELKIGETVKTKEGITQLSFKKKIEGLQTVYNLEIYREHNFLVSNRSLLVHNNCDAISSSITKVFGDSRRLNHFIHGGKNSVHRWESLVPDLNPSEISKIADDVLRNGRVVPYKSGQSKVLSVTSNGVTKEVQIPYFKDDAGIMNFSSGWVLK